QFDDDIGTRRSGNYGHAKGFGNWLDAFPAKTYAWSSALPAEAPRTITLTRGGKHRLRIQPRQPGHRIEQIWLSVSQKKIPAANATPVAGEIILSAADATKLEGE